MWIETFYHADREKVEHCILELLLWLHRLAIRSKAHSDAIAGSVRSTTCEENGMIKLNLVSFDSTLIKEIIA